MARSARTTAYLKEQVADALLELMAQKPYEEISISEITDLADVGRTTYYRHFTSKDDILNFKFETIFSDMMQHHPHHPPSSSKPREDLFRRHLEQIYAHRTTFETIYDAGLDYLLFRYLYRNTEEESAPEDIFARYQRAFHSAMMFSLTDQWIISGFSQTPAELSEMLARHAPQHAHEPPDLRTAQDKA